MVAVYDLAILGGSLAARQLAAQATGLFARVALIEPAQEDHRPAQKAAIAALNSPSAIGGRSREPSALQSQADFWDSLDWIEQLPIQEQQLLEAYAPQVLARLGVDYIPDQGKFPQIEGAPLWVQTTQRRLQARRYLIAVAEELAIPPESSIDPEAIAPLHHLESHLRPLPRSAPLAMVGDGPWTMALGQILQRRGHSIYLVAPGSLLPHEDPDAAYLLQGCLEASGIRIRTATPVEEARKTPQGVVLNTRQGQLRAALLLAPDWEKPSLKTLGLNPQQIPHGFSEEGSSLRTTPQLQTWHRQIFACGSALGGYSLP
ncbi:FAD-dependent oxidoreductase, partial [Lyngbya confervoides]